jgi:hypothetical protein
MTQPIKCDNCDAPFIPAADETLCQDCSDMFISGAELQEMEDDFYFHNED